MVECDGPPAIGARPQMPTNYSARKLAARFACCLRSATPDSAPVKVHLVDGTYELFRHFYAPRMKSDPVSGARRGLLHTMLTLLAGRDVTHVGVAFDHVIESFRNDLFAGYKTGAGLPRELLDQGRDRGEDGCYVGRPWT